MTSTAPSPQAFLATLPPFHQLAPATIAKLTQHIKLYRYEVGQPILTKEQLPGQISIVYQGQVRLLGYDAATQSLITLQRLEVGAILGWVSLMRDRSCETAIASTETVCLTIPAAAFLTILEQDATFRQCFERQKSAIEVFDVLAMYLQHRADEALILESAGVNSIREFASKAFSQVQIVHLQRFQALPPDQVWLVSNQNAMNLPIGQEFSATKLSGNLRLVGFPRSLFHNTAPTVEEQSNDVLDIDLAPSEPPVLDRKTKRVYPFVRGRGDIESAIACFNMLAQFWKIPFRKDVLRRVLQNQQSRGKLSLIQCGAVSELLGLQAQLAQVPVSSVHRLPTPAIVQWQESFAIVYETTSSSLTLAIPEIGIVRRQPADLIAAQSTESQNAGTIAALLLQPTRTTPKQKFGLSWFLPSLIQYRRILLEVFIASFLVQLFGLANPLVTQLIIDKVIVQNSPNTLQVFGFFLVAIAIFEALLSSLRTHLFVDTTNRIDLALGSEIIDHLLKLPLRYFDRRPVGELATRINELENIRQFLTGTALTVVLDALFSIVYIVVMFLYSWVLALVALATLPLFVILTVSVSPIVRRQLRVKSELNASAQSYLVEVLSGIQTVKAQNVELRSRWQWQERYAKYVSAGFKTVSTYTAASSTSTFLNQLSSLLVLWAGAYLVLNGQLTLGELIAFRIIAGYVTSPLLRLTQLWQNFQETALSLERLSDIVDSQPEADELDRSNIPLPEIVGQVKYENVSFRFDPNGALQLEDVSVEFEAGQFVAIVGQSGSGKSTLMKLLPRLYLPEAGRITVDGYNIHKVELYSLRRQIGIVPQDSLLFEGTVQENIALNVPDASPEDIIYAAKVAAAHDFIMNLPNGYNTSVGERGSSLSGGQRQRIAIARTVLQNPRLLILDEATSALDYESERQVCLNLAHAFKGRTVFFITHRLSTIRNADRILMMDQGSVVEQGTHEELIALRGRYYCLYQQQEAQL
ncbi:type I secretion system permease/ATPase [Leptolyngbya sp. NIES-2104]|uniref:type I secretion system permease/ATPase n=1 Tax=Leptolyngbya sp. NIES-2104 TaxID=1552121 RepID=UPI0006EC930A|nr:peptidase domain-containing ABC transporter [Leptolyngbya sp. NIES-2104]GAP95477.1 toxin secretion ABC transporter ATP-binding protein [Leptolyngbya sp. NIES-2104]